MNLSQLASRNLRRRPLRTLVSAAGVAIGLGALFTLVGFQKGYQSGVRTELDRLGADVLIVPKGCPYDAASIALHGARWPCFLKQQYLDGVRQVAGVRVAAPVFMNAFDQPDGSHLVFEGIDANILSLKRSWKIEGQFPVRPGEAILGADISRRRHWRIGDHIYTSEAGPISVTGVLAPTGGADDTFIFIRLQDAQQRFHHHDELTHILVQLKDPMKMETTVAQLHSCDVGLEMNVVPMANLFETIRSVVNATRALLGAVALAGLLVAGIGVSNTVLMSVLERLQEIGIMRAVGASPLQVAGVVWLEAIEICLAGSALGVAAALVASRAMENWLRSRLPFAPDAPLLAWDWRVTGACVLASLVLGVLAGSLPAERAVRVDPSTIIRS